VRNRLRKERRRDERREVSWIGRCGTDGAGSHACSVTDISREGIAVVILESAVVHVGDQVSMDIERIGQTTVRLHLHGTARDVMRRNADGALRVGVQLVFDTPQDEHTARTLFGT
jgi:hypothetical protein